MLMFSSLYISNTARQNVLIDSITDVNTASRTCCACCPQRKTLHAMAKALQEHCSAMRKRTWGLQEGVQAGAY